MFAGEALRDLLECVLRAGREDQIVAVAREAFGKIDADAGRGAGDERGLACARFVSRHRLSPVIVA